MPPHTGDVRKCNLILELSKPKVIWSHRNFFGCFVDFKSKLAVTRDCGDIQSNLTIMPPIRRDPMSPLGVMSPSNKKNIKKEIKIF